MAVGRVGVARLGVIAFVIAGCVACGAADSARSAGRVVSTYSVPGHAVDAAVSPDSARLYVLSSAGIVYVFDVSSGRVLAGIRVDADPTGMALLPNGAFLYVASQPDSDYTPGALGSASVAVVDTHTSKVISNLRLFQPGPTAIAASRDGRYVVAADANHYDPGAGVNVISTSTRTVAETIPTPNLDDLNTVTVSPDGSKIFSVGTNSSSGANVFVSIDTTTKSVVSRPASDGIYSDIVADPAGQYVYATISGSGAYASGSSPPPLAQTAQVLNANSLSVTTNLHLSDGLGGIALGPGGHIAYVTAGGNELLAINTTTWNVVATIHYPNRFGQLAKGVPDSASGIVVAPNGRYAYLTGFHFNVFGSNTVEEIRL